jgi:hypothetical protein
MVSLAKVFPDGISTGNETLIYDEGTWVPTITSSAGTATTVTTNFAKYVKTGKVVQIWVRLTITDKGTATGNIRVTLPFAPDAIGACGSAVESAASGIGGSTYVPNTSYLECFKYDATTYWVDGYVVNMHLSYTV